MKKDYRYFQFFIAYLIFSFNASADEVGAAIGVNISNYVLTNVDFDEFQKVDLFNPVEIYYQKGFNKYLGIRSSIKYTKKSIRTEIFKPTPVDTPSELTESIISDEEVIENIKTFFSLDISPHLYFKIKRIVFDLHVGISGDVFLYERNNSPYAMSGRSIHKMIWCFNSGFDIGYILTRQLKVGIKTTISRTISDIYKEPIYIYKEPNYTYYDTHFVNFYNCLYFGVML